MATRIRTAIVVVAALALAAVSAAQRPEGQGGPGRGMRMMGGPGGMPEAMLLGRPDVQRDLKLTDEQKTKLQALRDEMQEKMRGAFGGGPERRREGSGDRGEQAPPPQPQPGQEGAAGIRSREGFNPEEMRTRFEAMGKEANEKAKAILTEEQWLRLGQIKIQLAGPRVVIDDAEVGKKIGIKASQKLEINKLLEAQQQANMQIFMKMRDSGADRDALMAEIRKNDTILRDEIKKILNADQMKALGELEGPKFEADPNFQQGRFEFGGRGGRGGGGK